MSEIKPFVVNALLLGLLALAMISGGIMMAVDNNATQSIANDTAISTYANTLQSSLENASESATASDASFRNSSIDTSGGVIWAGAISGVWKTLTVVPSAVLSLTTNLVKGKILGSTAFYAIFGVVSLIIILSLILAIWKLVSTGEGGK